MVEAFLLTFAPTYTMLRCSGNMTRSAIVYANAPIHATHVYEEAGFVRAISAPQGWCITHSSNSSIGSNHTRHASC